MARRDRKAFKARRDHWGHKVRSASVVLPVRPVRQARWDHKVLRVKRVLKDRRDRPVRVAHRERRDPPVLLGRRAQWENEAPMASQGCQDLPARKAIPVLRVRSDCPARLASAVEKALRDRPARRAIRRQLHFAW
jgi:hypothetical protein